MRLKHFLSVFLTLLTLSVGQMWGETTFDWSGSSTATAGGTDYVVEKSPITLTFSKGTHSQNAPRTNAEGSVRMYTGNTLNIACSSGNITRIVFTATTSTYDATHLSYGGNALSSNDWTLSSPSSDITLSATAAARFTSIVIYTSGGATYDVEWYVGSTRVRLDEDVSSATPPSTAPANNALGSCANTFMGWSTTNIGSTAINDEDDIEALGLFTDASHAPALSADTKFYAVFATASGNGTSEITSTFTIKRSSAPGTPWTDTSHRNAIWTYSNLTFANTASAGMPNNSSLAVELPSGATAKSYSVTGTSNGWSTSNITITVKGEGLTGNITSFNNKGASYEFTNSNNAAGKYTFSCTTKSSKVAYIDHIDFVFEVSNVTYSNYVTTCAPTCTSLGSINGSFFWTSCF